MATVHLRVHDLKKVRRNSTSSGSANLESPNGLEKREEFIFNQLSGMQNLDLLVERVACTKQRSYLMKPQ